ncbi:hypothetical protein V6N11_069466 [Hibiscus sabdariffa]|uniref:Uncharacterized protein n=1 Tax=Hibiscus sabdariffa TaxID=183260 RepID=A0ABR2Q2W5_9ROSI
MLEQLCRYPSIPVIDCCLDHSPSYSSSNTLAPFLAVYIAINRQLQTSYWLELGLQTATGYCLFVEGDSCRYHLSELSIRQRDSTVGDIVLEAPQLCVDADIVSLAIGHSDISVPDNGVKTGEVLPCPAMDNLWKCLVMRIIIVSLKISYFVQLNPMAEGRRETGSFNGVPGLLQKGSHWSVAGCRHHIQGDDACVLHFEE